MRYFTSEHFSEDPKKEVESAIGAGNSMESVRDTLSARLQTEEKRDPRNQDEIARIQQQMMHLGSLSVNSSAA